MLFVRAGCDLLQYHLYLGHNLLRSFLFIVVTDLGNVLEAI
jgi:hypothetical protein